MHEYHITPYIGTCCWEREEFQVPRYPHVGGVGQGVSKSRPYIGRKMKGVSEAASYMDGKRNSYRSHALNEHEKEKVSQATP